MRGLVGVPSRCAIWGILQHLRRFGVPGRINIVEVIMYARRLGEVSFLAHLEGTPTGRHTGYSPELGALGCTGRIKIVEVIIYAGRLGSVFFGAPGRYAYWAP